MLNRAVCFCNAVVFALLTVLCGFLVANEPEAVVTGPTVPLKPLYERFAPRAEASTGSTELSAPDTDEVPDFQRHISPLLGRLGCNGRACHGSFQGQGGFRLSLFGYDFQADYRSLLEDGMGRVELNDKAASLVLTKPVDADLHDGGKRFEHGQWEYQVLRRWIEAGAPFESKHLQQLKRLEVTPEEIRFTEAGQTQQLNVVAHWEDGSIEDVTCLARFSTNDESVAAINAQGLVTAGQPGDTHVVVSYDNAVVPVATLRPLSSRTGRNYPQVAARTKIDRLVLAKLKKLGIVPSELCSDEEFLRRASLDVTGTLPSAEEVLAFASDNSPDKRERKIQELLSRPTYAAQWTTFFCDITGNNEDQLRNFLPQRVDPSSHWYQWIYQRLADNVPYDRFVEGIVAAESRYPQESYTEYCEAMSEVCRDESGQLFAERPGLVYYWARRNFQTAEDRAIGFAYAFLGVRIQCAQCHKHPFDTWSKDDFDQFEKLFAGVQARQNTRSQEAKKEYTQLVSRLGVDSELKGNQLRRQFGELLKEGKTVPMPELVVNQPRIGRGSKRKDVGQTQTQRAKLLGGEWIELNGRDVRGQLMQWLVSPANPYFSKSIVNRIWAQYFGVGIVNPPDDLNLANAPSNAPLLEYLADGFRASGFDLKWLHREILNSDTYQRSWKPNETNRLDQHNFSRSLLRRLPAESTYDALRMALARDGIADRLRALATERAITKPGASGRNNRRDDTSYALNVFGRSIRESNCDCDRSSEPSLLQTVFLANDSAVQQWLSDPRTSWLGQVCEKFDWEQAESARESSQADERMKKTLQRLLQQKQAADRRLADAERAGNSKLMEVLSKRRADVLSRAEAFAKKHGLGEHFAELTGIPLVANSPGGIDAAVRHSSAQELSTKDGPYSGMTREQALWVADHAYLRTLSRRPDSGERERVIEFLRSDEDSRSAVEGLLWSLVNTKEFILNH